MTKYKHLGRMTSKLGRMTSLATDTLPWENSENNGYPELAPELAQVCNLYLFMITRVFNPVYLSKDLITR